MRHPNRAILLAAITLSLVVPPASASALRATATASGADRSAPRCPSTDRQLRFRRYAALRRSLVPSDPGRLILCRYAGLNAPHPRSLVRSHRVRRARRIARIARLFDALKPPPYGEPVPCPADLGREIVARFRYRSSPDDLVEQDLTGCRFTTNGSLTRWALTGPGPRLIRLLRKLVPAR